MYSHIEPSLWKDGLPLEQTFIATLHDLCLKYFDVHGEQAAWRSLPAIRCSARRLGAQVASVEVVGWQCAAYRVTHSGVTRAHARTHKCMGPNATANHDTGTVQFHQPNHKTDSEDQLY